MKFCHASRSPEVTAREAAHSELVRRVAGECMVLLENDGTLPLTGPGTVALYGNGARATVKGGTGSGNVNSRSVVNIEQGLEAAGFTIASKPWLDTQEALAKVENDAYSAHLRQRAQEEHREEWQIGFDEHFIPTALAPFQKAEADAAIYVLSRNSGEGSDRSAVPGDYELTEQETKLLTALGEQYEKVILLLNVGGVINASAIRAIPGINAVLLISQSGNMGGHIVADVLLGKSIPSGRLTDTWAANYWDYPSAAQFSHNNGDLNDEYYREGIYVGYRYFDTFGIEPVYPFGYGLGYSTFAMQTKAVTADAQTVTVAVQVTNTGSTYAGKEVVQIYASAPGEGLEKPYQVLAAFGKTSLLRPGERQTLTISFPLTSLESYDPAKAAYVLEKGAYLLRVGRHSRSTSVAAVLMLDETAVTRQVKNICPPDVEFEELSPAARPAAELPDVPVIAISAADIPTVAVSYGGGPAPFTPAGTAHPITLTQVRDGAYTMEQLVSQLTLEEMADLCVGISRHNAAALGSAAVTVPGAAGDTSTLLAYRDVRTMTSADGPAGLRLRAHFRTDAAGSLIAFQKSFDAAEEEMEQAKEGETDCYQYCTATPIAWLLASSWDLDLITSLGDMVGAELEQFGVQIWLAPGMNLHRNPLCGRNFEYYSEDPLLSGLCAAASVRGVQRHPGTGACVKHFFANNQEDNRMFVNAHIRERALRELYLRGFRIAIEAAQPMTLMTSYNLVNGVHAANSYDAITCFAREECGFAGYVMTDWTTSDPVNSRKFAKPGSIYPCSSSPLCIYAGNDLQMPGCEGNVTDIIAAVRDGSLPLGYLQQCCKRLLEGCLRCACFETAPPYHADRKLASFLTVNRQ